LRKFHRFQWARETPAGVQFHRRSYGGRVGQLMVARTFQPPPRKGREMGQCILRPITAPCRTVCPTSPGESIPSFQQLIRSWWNRRQSKLRILRAATRARRHETDRTFPLRQNGSNSRRSTMANLPAGVFPWKPATKEPGLAIRSSGFGLIYPIPPPISGL